MPLEKEFSIVADSTVSSSPPPDVDDDASAVVKRPAKTYGKRREEPLEKSSDTPLSYSNSTSRDSFRQTAPPGLSEEIAATPLRIHREDSNAGSTDIDDESSQTTFAWAWKADLARIDRDEDTEHVRISSESTLNDLPTDTVFGRPVLLQGVSTTATNQNVVPDQSASPSLPVPPNDIFGGGTFSGPSSPPGPHAKRSFVLSSPLVAPTSRARHFNDKSDLESDGEPSKASSSNTPSSSSQPLHNINTPKSKSSYTSPPTSDDDMPANVLPKGRSSGKRKRLSTRSNVPQLELIEAPLSEPKTRNPPAEKKGKIKAPTKRDKQEMIKERSRLAAESSANIPRQTVGKYTKEHLFKTIGEASRRKSAPPDNLEPVPISDPIEAYSSPVNVKTIGSIHAPGPSRLAGSSKISPMPRSPGELDSDGEDLPEVPDIFKEVAEKKKKELLAAKLRALKQQKMLPNVRPTNDDDDDLGLEIVRPNPRTGVKDEDERRRSPEKSFISETRKQQLQLAHVNPAKQKMIKSSVGVDVRRMQVDPGSEIFQHGGRTDQQTLSRVVGLRAQADARKLASLKQEEWKKHGGRIAERLEIQAEGYSTVLKTIADKGLEIVKDESRMYVEDEDEGEDGSDADWDPELRGSASPELERDDDEDEADGAEGLDEENDENMAVDPDATMVDDDLEVFEGPKARSNRRSLMVVPSDSEEEGDENDENMSVHPVASSSQERYRRATSSCELPTEDEQDKENNTILMYDRSEDKENTAVVRHAPLSFFDNEMASPSQSPSTTGRDWITRADRMDDGRSAERRKPFQELISDESPSSQSRTSTLTQSFAAKLQQSSQLPNTLAATPLKPFLGGGLQSEKSFGGFSQFSEGDSDPFGTAPLLEPGFSDLFESGTEKQKSKARKLDLSDEALSDENDLTTLKRTDNLGLTQDVNAVAHLQPAFQDGRLMRKADAIFEKEQAFVVEAAIKKPANQKPELYVNDHGFLTQTRPAEGTPEVYRPIVQTKYDTLRGAMLSPSQAPQPRPPLRTLSMTASYQPESPDGLPLRRLRKNVTPPRDQDDFPTRHGSLSTTPPRRQNAFDMLAQGAAKAQRRAELKQKLSAAGMNEYFENEAAESDEDDAFGFGRAKRNDDEEGGEDLDKTLDELMDDNAMDEDTVAADLVLEKFKEQEEAQDQEDERLHMAAIQGELRRKRTRGVGVDDSDEDSDDDGNDKARRAMKKLRTTDRGDIRHLEANEATRSFAETYNQTLKDDDDEFAYLNKESQIDDVLNAGGVAAYSDDDDEEEEDEEPQPRTISADEIKRTVRAMAEKVKSEEDEVAMDPEDLSWLDEDDDEDTPRVKTVTARPRPRDQLRDQELDGTLSGLLRKPSEPMNASSKQWYAQENKSRNAGTSRSVGGSAITGHTRAKPKGPSRTASESVSASTTARKLVKTERSMLSAIADKSRHFA